MENRRTFLLWYDREACYALHAKGYTTTKRVYLAGKTPSARKALANETGVSEEEITRIMHHIDLLRVTGVGPAYAKFLYERGITTVAALLAADAETLIEGTELREEDVAYCKRFARHVPQTIVWEGE